MWAQRCNINPHRDRIVSKVALHLESTHNNNVCLQLNSCIILFWQKLNKNVSNVELNRCYKTIEINLKN